MIYEKGEKLKTKTFRISMKYEYQFLIDFLKIIRTYRDETINFIEKWKYKAERKIKFKNYSYKVNDNRLSIFYKNKKVDSIKLSSKLNKEEIEQLYNDVVDNYEEIK